MKVLVVFAHPSHKSFNYALLEAFVDGLKKGGHQAEVLDLYKDGFDPVLRQTKHGGEKNKQVPAYQKKVKEADCLAFIFPTFWYRAPAILEGWFDQVMEAGFAFRYRHVIGSFSRPIGLLPMKKAVVIETYGGPGWYYILFFFRIPWLRFRSILRFCGLNKIIHHPCYSVQHTTEKKLKRYLKEVERIGETLK